MKIWNGYGRFSVNGRIPGRHHMGGSSTPANTTSTTTTDIPPEFKPYATELLNRGVKASQLPYTAYTGARTTGFTGPQSQALTNIQNISGSSIDDRERARYALTNAVTGNYSNSMTRGDYSNAISRGEYNNATMRGDYLSPASNPWLQATYNQGAQSLTDAYSTGTAAQTDAAAARAGALGGSGYNQQTAMNQYGLGQNLANLATDIYGGNYQSERARQDAAVQQERQNQVGAILAERQNQVAAIQAERQNQLAAATGFPTFNQQSMAPSQTLFDIGAQQQALGQHGLDISYADWLQKQQYPLQQLDILGSTIGQAMGHGSTTTTTAPYTGSQYNPWSGVLAGGLGAGALYNQYAQGGGSK